MWRGNAASAVRGLATAAVLLGVVALSRSAASAEEGEVERERFNLSPAYTAGTRFRVERRFRQTTVTSVAARRANPLPPVNFSDYDASLEIDATVTVEAVNDVAEATIWEARFDRVRVDIPDPIQSKEYRLRQRERKAKGLPHNAHPLEGSTVKCDVTGKKPRIYRVLRNGEDAGISQRYPEIVPLMQDLVEPDWVPVDTVPLFGEWEMTADHIFRLTKVLAKAPLEGKIRCRLVAVANGMAEIDVRARLSETYAKVEMAIDVWGRIEFDVKARRVAYSHVKGEVQITSPGSSLRGAGTLFGETQWSAAPDASGG
jgi:hypothetical protein